MSKKRTTRESSPLKANKEVDPVEKKEKRKPTQKQLDAWKNNGGAREGSGQKPNLDRERQSTLKDEAELHAMKVVDVTITTRQGRKTIKKQRANALLDVLFREGIKKNIMAIREYFDRTRGKARQEVDFKGEIKTKEQYVPDDPALQVAAQAYAQAVKLAVINEEDEDD